MVSWKGVVRYRVCMVCLLLNQICFEVWHTARGMPHLDKIALARGPSWKFCAESATLSVCRTKHWQKSKHNSRQEKAPQNRQRHRLQSSSQGIKQEAASDRKPTEQKTESIKKYSESCPCPSGLQSPPQTPTSIYDRWVPGSQMLKSTARHKGRPRNAVGS